MRGTSHLATPLPFYAATLLSYATPVVIYVAPLLSCIAPLISYAAPVISCAAPVISYAAPLLNYASYILTRSVTEDPEYFISKPLFQNFKMAQAWFLLSIVRNVGENLYIYGQCVVLADCLHALN